MLKYVFDDHLHTYYNAPGSEANIQGLKYTTQQSQTSWIYWPFLRHIMQYEWAEDLLTLITIILVFETKCKDKYWPTKKHT